MTSIPVFFDNPFLLLCLDCRNDISITGLADKMEYPLARKLVNHFKSLGVVFIGEMIKSEWAVQLFLAHGVATSVREKTCDQ